MKVLIACEFSGIVREAFTAKGHDAWSCDLLDTEILGQHIQEDVSDILNEVWDLMVAHPPCTYLCNSGVRWLYHSKNTVERWDLMKEASNFFSELWDADIKKICIENPIPHKYGALPKYNQIVQPWMFGDGETKATCLWLKNLPKLAPTKIVSGRKPTVHYEPPGPERQKNRSRTYKGIAAGMAEQWG